MVVKCLTPCNERESSEGLRLEFEGEVEVLYVFSNRSLRSYGVLPALSHTHQMVHHLSPSVVFQKNLGFRRVTYRPKNQHGAW